MEIKMYPFLYEDYRICLHCGSKSVHPINEYNKVSDNMIYPIVKFKCSKCNTEFYIKWIRNSNNELVPTCCGKESLLDVIDNIIEFSKENKRSM